MSNISWHAHTYTGMHKQMPLSIEQHQCQCAPHPAEHQIIPLLCGVFQSSVLHTHLRARGLCKYIYILRSLNLRQNHSAISSHISMCVASFCTQHKHTRLCMYSCLQLRGALLQLWCGSRRWAQKTSRLMKVAGLCELFLLSSTRFARRHNTQEQGTRLRVNIHVIAMK